MKCVIPCAGESSRMSYIPKMLININGRPLLSYIIEFWQSQVDNFIFIVKRQDTFLWGLFPEGSAIVFQDEPKGLADAILRAEPFVGDRFIVALGDCLNIGEFESREGQADIGIGVWETYDLAEINKSYLVGVSPADSLVEDVIEKPNIKVAHGNCGMGTYFLDYRVFEFIRNKRVAHGGGDFTAVLQDMIDAGLPISPVWFQGKYVNVGSPEDIAKAERILG